VKRREKLTGAHLEAFDAAIAWAGLGTGARTTAQNASEAKSSATEKTAS
jgi:hypothetical protein